MKSEKSKWILLLIVVFLTGCATTVNSHPKQIPPIDLSIVSSYQENLSVDLINDQPDTTPKEYTRLVGINKSVYTSLTVNYNEWTRFFIDSYTAELNKRGVKVYKDSPNKIKARLSNFGYFLFSPNLGFTSVARVNIVVQLLSSDDKWSKIYHEWDESGWSRGRAFGSVIYHTIEKLLKDPEVIDRMRISDVK